VRWVGGVDDERKNQLLGAASVLVMCSNSESFGMSAAEAMAAGTPVVVTRTCPWPDVDTHNTGYWVEQTAGAIADAVDGILSNPAAAREMGRRGRELIAANYSWPRAAAALIREYHTIAR
jgi:glycosyltransferase involved in cell wall biosynthesis